MKISGMVDFITFCGFGNVKICYEPSRGTLKGLNKAQKSLQIRGQVEVQTEGDKDMKISGIVDLIEVNVIGCVNICVKALMGL